MKFETTFSEHGRVMTRTYDKPDATKEDVIEWFGLREHDIDCGSELRKLTKRIKNYEIRYNKMQQLEFQVSKRPFRIHEGLP